MATSKYGTPAVVGGDPAVDEQKQELAEKAEALKLDAESSASERELRRAREELADERAKVEKLQALQKRWVDGDYTDLPADHPFMVTIQTSDKDGEGYPVPVAVNGRQWYIPRGKPTQVPHVVVQVLDGAKINATQRMVNPVTNALESVRVFQHRFPFNAHPVYVS